MSDNFELIAKYVNFGELKTAIKALNTEHSLDPAIKVIGVKKLALVEAFDTTVAKLSEDETTEFSDAVIEFYNGNFSEEAIAKFEEQEKGAEDPAPAAKKKTAPKKAAAKKAAKPAGDKAGPTPPGKYEGNLSKLGHREGSQAAKIDEGLLKGGTLKEIADSIPHNIGRVTGHIRHLELKHADKVKVEQTPNESGKKADIFVKATIL